MNEFCLDTPAGQSMVLCGHRRGDVRRRRATASHRPGSRMVDATQTNTMKPGQKRRKNVANVRHIAAALVLIDATLRSPHHFSASSFSVPLSSSSSLFTFSSSAYPSSSSSSLSRRRSSSPLHNKHHSSPLHDKQHRQLPTSSRSFSNTNNDEFPQSSSSPDMHGQDPFSKYTHQIAIPLDNASELHSALRAIQVSLVRDCPRLVRACVMPPFLRMPLLYVDAGSRSFMDGEKANVKLFGGDDDGTSDGGFEELLESVVHKAIRTVVYEEDDGVRQTSSVAEPILLPFRGLELQGSDNSVLYAVGMNTNDRSITDDKNEEEERDKSEDNDGVRIVDDWSSSIATNASAKETAKVPDGRSGWETLEKLVHAIQKDLEHNYGLDTCWPLDAPQGEEEDDAPITNASKECRWRPRVPFVRLPQDFYQDIDADFEKRKKQNDGEEPSPVDFGFDGISPLFWYEAWGQPQEEDADLLPPPGVRMRSVAVYRRMMPDGGEAESSFFPISSSSAKKPYSEKENASSISMELPAGDAKLQARERRETAKAMDRMGEMESREEREWEEKKTRWINELDNPQDENSISEFDVGTEIDKMTAEEDAACSDQSSTLITGGLREQEEEPTPLNDDEPIGISSLENEPLQQASNTQALRRPMGAKPRRELPSIEDNPVFQRLWDAQPQITPKGQKDAVALKETPPDEPLPPYPSNGHFVGVWRVVSLPFPTEILEDEGSKSSNNFILRVDGQVMGGPVLDVEYRQKAAGGEWQVETEANQNSDFVNSDSSDSALPPVATKTRLRIRLLVPPKKERCLVMEGEVTRLVMPGGPSDGWSEGWALPSGGILDGMLQNINNDSDDKESKQIGGSETGSSEALLYCAGEAWVEDAGGTGANRTKLGPFSLMKLKKVDRNELIYTVDLSQRNLADEENEANDRQ